MSFGAAKDLVLKVDNDGGALVDISAYVTSVGISTEHGIIQVSTLGKNWHEQIRGMSSLTLQVEGVYDPVPGTLLPKAGTITSTQSVEWYPQGTAAGKQKATFEAFVGSVDMPGALDDAVTWSATFTSSGTVTFGTA